MKRYQLGLGLLQLQLDLLLLQLQQLLLFGQELLPDELLLRQAGGGQHGDRGHRLHRSRSRDRSWRLHRSGTSGRRLVRLRTQR